MHNISTPKIDGNKVTLPNKQTLTFPNPVNNVYRVISDTNFLILDNEGRVFYHGENPKPFNLRLKPLIVHGSKEINLGSYKVKKISALGQSVIFLAEDAKLKEHLLINQSTFEKCVEVNNCASLLAYIRNPEKSWYDIALALYDLPLPPSSRSLQSTQIEEIEVNNTFIKIQYGQPNTRVVWLVEFWYCGKLPAGKSFQDFVEIDMPQTLRQDPRVHYQQLGQSWFTALPLWQGHQYQFSIQ